MLAGLTVLAAACSGDDVVVEYVDTRGVMTCRDGSYYSWIWSGDPDMSQEPPPLCPDGTFPTFIETTFYSPPTTVTPTTVMSTPVPTSDSVPVGSDESSTTTLASPASTAPPIWAEALADLDGDGEQESLELSDGFLRIDEFDVPLPGPHPEDWTELFVIDVDPGDGRLEAALLRWLGEDDHELLIVAFDGTDWFWDRPVRLYNMSTGIFDGAVLNGHIDDRTTNCGITTEIYFEFGMLADVVLERTTFTDADPEPCFG